jgi:hypothetical protein
MKSRPIDKKTEYYLNDYGDAIPRFRIERSRGPKVVWHERAKIRRYARI